jgi:hypothetical protein
MRIITNQHDRRLSKLGCLDRGATFQYESHQYMKIDPKCHGMMPNAIKDHGHILVVNLKHGSCRTLHYDTNVLKTDSECHISIEERYDHRI